GGPRGAGGDSGGGRERPPAGSDSRTATDSHGRGEGDLRVLLGGDTEAAARALIGHTLVRVGPDGLRREGRIIETEAYTGDDPSSHSYRGRSARNASMFEQAGTAYVYLIYGIHHCLNVVTRASGTGEAVLIRAVEPTRGIAAMAKARGIAGAPEEPSAKTVRRLCSGPGKLCEALGIDMTFDGADLLSPSSPLYIDTQAGRSTGCIVSTTRVGISRARNIPRRFLEAENRFVSRPANDHGHDA
ncbi:MAG: DNA-3-methyladenine glycosylase, partial [bacterium]